MKEQEELLLMKMFMNNFVVLSVNIHWIKISKGNFSVAIINSEYGN